MKTGPKPNVPPASTLPGAPTSLISVPPRALPALVSEQPACHTPRRQGISPPTTCFSQTKFREKRVPCAQVVGGVERGRRTHSEVLTPRQRSTRWAEATATTTTSTPRRRAPRREDARPADAGSARQGLALFPHVIVVRQNASNCRQHQQ